ncbi:MAG TPA: TIM barrel protein [Terracidiphilus sp.]|nr:TIM barrel protein [Terracidiphilus sp.]
MNRREFAQAMATAALGVAGSVRAADAEASAGEAGAGAGPFPLSVMLWTIERERPFEERLATVAEAGYRNVELVGEYAGWDVAEFARAHLARKRLGLKFDATAGLKHGVADATVREAFLAELEAAMRPMETLECPAMIVLSGNVVEGQTREQQHAAAVETLKQAAALVEGRTIGGEPVRLLLECIDPEENPHYLMTRASEAIEVVRAVGHPQVQFLYDIYHEQIAEGNLTEKLEKHIDVIGLIHVADVPGRHAPGTGEIHYANLYRTLARLGYAHRVAMEFIPQGDAVAELRAARLEVAKDTRRLDIQAESGKALDQVLLVAGSRFGP